MANSKRTARLFHLVDRAIFHPDSSLSYPRTLEGLDRLVASIAADPWRGYSTDWYLAEPNPGLDYDVLQYGPTNMRELILGAFEHLGDHRMARARVAVIIQRATGLQKNEASGVQVVEDFLEAMREDHFNGVR